MKRSTAAFNKVKLPTNIDGTVDWEDLFSLAVGRLRWSPSEYYESTPNEIHLAITGKEEADRDFFEQMANVVTVGYARTQTRKKIELFDKKKDKKASVGKIDKARKQQELDALQEEFGT